MAFWEGCASDETMVTFAPVVVYWLYAGFYQFVLPSEFLNQRRLHTREEEEEKNAVAMWTAAKGVLFHQLLQIAAAQLWFSLTSTRGVTASETASPPAVQPPIPIQILQIAVAMFVMDTWQYFGHRFMHENKFLFRHVHSLHHELVVPYAIGALYHHWFQALLLDTGGGVLSFLVTGMTPRTAAVFFCFVTVKAVDDHCGVWFPGGNVFHRLFATNSAYHDVHHQRGGRKYNFSQPFFPVWDKLLGTHMAYVVLKRPEGGYEVRMVGKE